ncbi:MAG TPA: choice-of-anchor D domain-containing protein [Candidatus Solibacter sp.]|nr:choice-of-anchor D domain-containing protein [Candidatus Solibacter sp.]
MDRLWRKTELAWRIAGAFLAVALSLTLSSCGGSSSGSHSPQGPPQIAGNWQFAMATTGTSFVASPLQGGFLLQQNGSITGQIALSIVLPSSNGGANIICNSGTAQVTGTMSGQGISLTASVGSLDQNGNPITQTITLSGGSLSSDNQSIQKGTYSVSAGFANVNGQLMPCGLAEDAGSWSAILVPPLTGAFEGFFHSTTSASFSNQDFAVSGTFTQGANVGASSATVTGTINFIDPVTQLTDYPCLATASLNGTITGNTVLLQIFSTNGLPVGQIGATPGAGSGPTTVSFDSTQSGYVLHNVNGAHAGQSGGGYVVTTKPCSGQGDSGNLCLAIGSSKACNQPITITPFALIFPAQLVGSPATSQTVTLTNNTGSQLSGATLRFSDNDSALFYQFPIFGGDFNGVSNFTEQNNCTQQGSITLDAGASCTITVSFAPQESCPWLPQAQGTSSINGLAPALCPVQLSATLTVTVPSGGVDADNQFSLPATGFGLSAVVPSVPELDFGAEAVGEASPPQTLTFTNQSPKAVTILPSAGPCVFSSSFLGPATPRPPLDPNGTPLTTGLQLAETAVIGLNNSSPILNDFDLLPPLVNAPTVEYFCDTDLPVSKGGSGTPNFVISADQCSGQTLQPFGQSGNSCSLQITFVPQPGTWSRLTADAGGGLDDFLQLNTAWCGDANNPAENNCEVDSGRFPVEIKTNPPSPLRLTPGAGLDFGYVIKGSASNTLNITLFNDPVDPNSATVSFASKLVTGDYLETDTCPPTLAPNESCTFSVTFTPKITGSDRGQITITYSTPSQIGLVQTIYLRGFGQ